MGVQLTQGRGHQLSPQNAKISPESYNFKKYFIEVRCSSKLSTMKDDIVATKTHKEQAIELFATNPDIEVQKVAEIIGVNRVTVSVWRQDPSFHQKVLSRFNLELEGRLPSMLSALERECLAGNINGLKLILEYLNKLQKNVSLVVLSPFEEWLQSKNIKNVEDIEEAEMVDMVDVSNFKELPPRTDKNNHMEVHRERVRLKNAPLKDKSIKKRNKARRELYKWQKRAIAAGVGSLPARRPTPGQRKAWEKEIIKKEKQASKLLQEQAGNNKTPCKPKTQKQGSPKTPTPPSS